MQTGLVMLIGLVSKTAILLTEFASELRKKGMSIVESAITAAKMRLRAILMTSLTMIAGMIPMVLASGAGANGNISLGVCVVGGMSFGILGLLITTPICFIALQIIFEGLHNQMQTFFLHYQLTTFCAKNKAFNRQNVNNSQFCLNCIIFHEYITNKI